MDDVRLLDLKVCSNIWTVMDWTPALGGRLAVYRLDGEWCGYAKRIHQDTPWSSDAMVFLDVPEDGRDGAQFFVNGEKAYVIFEKG